MLRAKRTGSEVDLSGSAIDLNFLADNFIRSDHEINEIEIDREYNPIPYKEILSKIVIHYKSQEKMLIEVIGDNLVFNINAKTGKILSRNLSQFAVNGISGDHFHYDALSFDDIVDQSSVDLVFGLI